MQAQEFGHRGGPQTGVAQYAAELVVDDFGGEVEHPPGGGVDGGDGRWCGSAVPVPVRGARQQDRAYEDTARWGASARDAGLDHRPCLIMRSRESEP